MSVTCVRYPKFISGAEFRLVTLTTQQLLSPLYFSPSHDFLSSHCSIYDHLIISLPQKIHDLPTLSPSSWSSSFESHPSFPTCFLPTTNRPPQKRQQFKPLPVVGSMVLVLTGATSSQVEASVQAA